MIKCGCAAPFNVEESESGTHMWAVCSECHCEQRMSALHVFCPQRVSRTEPSYTRPGTGNHPEHPPVEGGYRGDK